MAKAKGLLLGTALGSLLGSMGGSVPKSPKKIQEWADKAVEMGESVFDKVKNWKHNGEEEHGNFTKGAVFGLLIGAGSALLLSPKTGKQIRKDLTKTYHEAADSAQDIVKYFKKKKPAIKKALTTGRTKMAKAKAKTKKLVKKTTRKTASRSSR